VSLLALIAWIITAGGGLYLLSIWLIEYDKDFHSVAATRLPPAVLASHVMLAGGGLLVWAGYLILDSDRLAWTAVAALGLAATLGLVMAVRWLGVYRAGRAAARARRLEPHLTLVGGQSRVGRGNQAGDGRVGVLAPSFDFGPPERNFPLPVVIAHGAFAAVTITLVLLTALGVGGS
jgi:manganese efflux pump family protein